MTQADDAAASFSLRRVQALLGLSRTIVAGLIEEGFVAPTRGKRNEWRFTFQDLMLLRTAHALQTAKIPPRKILRSLARLKATLPHALPLTGLRITAIGADVAVRDREGQLRSDSGQLLMDFEVEPAAGSVSFFERTPAPAVQPDAATCYARGVALEATDPARAELAYRQALALAPALAEAYLNLGAMCAEAGRFDDMEALSAQAVLQCPQVALVHFNRGVALDHLERLEEAEASYESSLALDPALADAHYNLGRLREQVGDKRGALRHFSAYRRLQR
ncbi:MAG: tetratricopeptide repeat protein [Rubrivivax sp.]